MHAGVRGSHWQLDCMQKEKHEEWEKDQLANLHDWILHKKNKKNKRDKCWVCGRERKKNKLWALQEKGQCS